METREETQHSAQQSGALSSLSKTSAMLSIVYWSWDVILFQCLFLACYLWRHPSTTNHRFCLHWNRSCDWSLTADVTCKKNALNADWLISDFCLARRIEMTNSFYRLCVKHRFPVCQKYVTLFTDLMSLVLSDSLNIFKDKTWRALPVTMNQRLIRGY